MPEQIHEGDAEAIYRRLIETEKRNVVLREALAGTLERRASVAAQVGRREEAADLAHEALAVLDDTRSTPAVEKLRREIESALAGYE